jgi:hypothetical protein
VVGHATPVIIKQRLAPVNLPASGASNRGDTVRRRKPCRSAAPSWDGA